MIEADDIARRIELERADAARRAITEAIKRIEGLDGNLLYQQAWKAAVRAVRSINPSLIDK